MFADLCLDGFLHSYSVHGYVDVPLNFNYLVITVKEGLSILIHLQQNVQQGTIAPREATVPLLALVVPLLLVWETQNYQIASLARLDSTVHLPAHNRVSPKMRKLQKMGDGGASAGGCGC